MLTQQIRSNTIQSFKESRAVKFDLKNLHMGAAAIAVNGLMSVLLGLSGMQKVLHDLTIGVFFIVLALPLLSILAYTAFNHLKLNEVKNRSLNILNNYFMDVMHYKLTLRAKEQNTGVEIRTLTFRNGLVWYTGAIITMVVLNERTMEVAFPIIAFAIALVAMKFKSSSLKKTLK